MASLIKKRNSFIQKANETREVLIQNVEMLQIEIKNRAKDLQVVENEIDTLRKGLKLVKQDIIRYFMETLKQGNDTRGEGIYTTVKHLIGFKIDLKNENFPGVLDEASISCIQNIALKHIVLDELYEKLAQCYSNKGSISHHSLSIQDRIASLKKTVRPNCILYIRKYFSFFAVSKSEDKKCQVIQNGPLSKDTKLSLIKSAG